MRTRLWPLVVHCVPNGIRLTHFSICQFSRVWEGLWPECGTRERWPRLRWTNWALHITPRNWPDSTLTLYNTTMLLSSLLSLSCICWANLTLSEATNIHFGRQTIVSFVMIATIISWIIESIRSIDSIIYLFIYCNRFRRWGPHWMWYKFIYV